MVCRCAQIDAKLKEKYFIKMFDSIRDIKRRNEQILKAMGEGYSQHGIAKVLDISQPAVYGGAIKRSNRQVIIVT